MANTFKAALLPRLVETVKGLAGTGWGVYPLIAPVGTTGDVIVVRQEGETVERCKMGISRTVGRFRCYVLSEGYTAALGCAMSLAEGIETLLVGGEPVRIEGIEQDFTDGRAAVVLIVEIG